MAFRSIGQGEGLFGRLDVRWPFAFRSQRDGRAPEMADGFGHAGWDCPFRTNPDIGARIRGEARVPPQKILKAPLSAQLGIDETSSDALNEKDAELNSENSSAPGETGGQSQVCRVIGRKTAGIGGGNSGGCRGRGVGRGLPRYRRPG